MEQHRRRKQQRSRERKEEAAAKDAAAKDASAASREPSTKPLEIGAADRRLDALIEEEIRSRARSVPASSTTAEVKRLGSSMAASLGPQGPPVTYHPPHPAQEQVHQLVMDPRGQSMGLGHLQEAVRHSFEVLQNALRGPQQPGPTLLDPLLRQADQGVPHVHDHGGPPGHALAAGTPVRDVRSDRDGSMVSPMVGSVGREALHPRTLDPYAAATPVGPLSTVNPFWSTSLQQAAKGEGHARMAESSGKKPAPSSPGAGDVEKIRAQILREAEDKFAREVKRLTDGGAPGDASSYASAASAGIDGGRVLPEHPGLPPGDPVGTGVPPCTKPDLPPGLGGGPKDIGYNIIDSVWPDRCTCCESIALKPRPR